MLDASCHMPTLKQIIEQNDTGIGRRFDLFIQFLIVASLVAFSVETMPRLSEATQSWLHRFEIFCVAVFTIEYLLRAYTATRTRSYVLSFFGLIDLAPFCRSTLPLASTSVRCEPFGCFGSFDSSSLRVTAQRCGASTWH